MTDSIEHLAIAFANSRPSERHDKLTDLRRFSDWAAGWPALAPLARKLRAADVELIRHQRDAAQLVLRARAIQRTPPREALATATATALEAAPFTVRAGVNGLTVVAAEPAAAVQHMLGRATVDLLLAPEGRLLRRCENVRCHKVFVANRANRRWCDTRVCGNRARVAAHARRQSTSGSTSAS